MAEIDTGQGNEPAMVEAERPVTIATISGKGGVGKSTVTVGIGYALKGLGYRVGLLDLDLESSSLGDVLGITRGNLVMREKIEPVVVNGLKAVSLSLFPEEEFEDVPTLISEERVYALVAQMFKSVNWGEIDFLLADHPPGTGPELRGLIREKIHGLILVTATQRLSEMPVRRLVRMAREEYRLPILGVVSNNPYNISTYDSGKAIAKRYGLPILATIPWDPKIAQAMDQREPIPTDYFLPVARTLAAKFFPQRALKREAASGERRTRKKGEKKGEKKADV